MFYYFLSSNKLDLAFIWLRFPLLSLSMAAGLLMMEGSHVLGSDEWSLDRMLPGQRSNSWAGTVPIWCTEHFEGDLPTVPVNFELFIHNKLCLVSFCGFCQFGGCEFIALKNGFECGVTEIPAHAGGDTGPLPHFSAHPVIVRAGRMRFFHTVVSWPSACWRFGKVGCLRTGSQCRLKCTLQCHYCLAPTSAIFQCSDLFSFAKGNVSAFYVLEKIPILCICVSVKNT